MLEVVVQVPYLSKSSQEICQMITFSYLLTDLAIAPDVVLGFFKTFDESLQFVIYTDHIFQVPHMLEALFDLVQIDDDLVQLINFSYLWKAIPSITLDGR